MDVAYALQEGLERDLECTVWSQGVFQISRTAMHSLVGQLKAADFGIFVFAPDDIAQIRNTRRSTVRDNVIFELGLFAGKLGIERCFVVVPRESEELRLPSDLLGLVPATYESHRQDGNLVAALGPVCSAIRRALAQLGATSVNKTSEITDEKVQETLISDPIDCVALIQSWMGKRPMDENTRAMRFSDVDRELNLSPGSTEKYIEQAAAHWDYVVDKRGKDIILFKDRPGTHRWMV